ncbi:glycosyltransferase family 39 protein [Pleurocapsales cyanobacterium LEGE 10410]|nr:glycosyltransferase family 39 protein [Pleurocapsales cyanobacterium LEGE 10410]
MRAIKNLLWIDISILLLSLIVTLLGIDSYGLYEPHEGHFAMVGQEMVWRNDWITPYLNGSPYLNKPPLLYWSIASSISIFGSTEFAARLPVSLAGWLGIVIAWKWTRELWGISASRVCALMLSVTFGWFIFTHQILIDVLLGTLLLSSNYFLWRSLYQNSRINWWGAYVSLALCVLTKGLIGVVFPLLGCLALMIIRQDWQLIKRIKIYQGMLLVLCLILPWFIAVEHNNPGFLHYFIVNEHLDRLLDRRFPPDYEVSKVSAGGYLAITAFWCFPWILFLPSVIKSSWQEWHRGVAKNASLVARQHSDGVFLLAVAATLPVVLFLPLSSRLIYYSVPAIPAYIILCAGWWDKYSRRLSSLSQASRRFISKSSSVRINLYGVIAVVLGISFYSVVSMVSSIVQILPAMLPTPEVTSLISIIGVCLGTGWLALGIGLLRRSALAWIPLSIVLIITYLATIRGFYLYQDLRSSKSLVIQANSCLSIDTLWTFEGSREIGAAGAIGYYLNQNKVGWATKNNAYRTVMILADGGKNRIPPRFPGSPPQYLITKAQLQTYWDSDRPVVFLTDFLRQPDDDSDPLTLNLPQGAIKPYIIRGQRRLYLNRAAQKLAQKKCQ